MTTQPQDKAKKVLVVDDDQNFLQSLIRALERLDERDRATTHLELIPAPDVAKALAILQNEPIDIALTDVRMPGVDGLQFLQLMGRRYPEVQKIVLTGYADDDTRTASMSAGASLFLEKPRTSSGLGVIYKALLETAGSFQDDDHAGFSGVVAGIDIREMIQMLSLSGKSVLLRITVGGVPGEIYIDRGRILHAGIEELEGIGAFEKIVASKEGDFQVDDFHTPAKRTLFQSANDLLLEVSKREDEGQRPVADAPQLVETEVVPQERPGQGAPPTGDAKTHLTGRITIVTERYEPIPPTKGPCGASSDDVANVVSLALDEAVVCTNNGSVVFNANSESPELRVDLLEFLTLKKRQIAEALNIHGFSRVDIQGDAFTAVAELGGERSFFAMARGNGIQPEEVASRLQNYAEKNQFALT